MRTRGLIIVVAGLVCLLRTGASRAEPLPGTQPLIIDRPLDEVMVEGIDRFALRELAESVAKREQYWNRDYSNREAYEKSIAPNRERFKTIIGAVDPRVKPQGIELLATTTRSAVVARGDNYTVFAVRWPVLDGVSAEGLLLQPAGKCVARVVVVPDADVTPEMMVGLAGGIKPQPIFVRWLVENGCEVLIPTLINREDTFSGNPEVRMTNQPHREFIYRQAFEMGRHIIGYEVQKVLAAVDQFAKFNADQKLNLPIALIGVGEGGLIALYSAACDTRPDFVHVSGYFQPREDVIWREPIYRNVWGLLTEFGDAEIVSMIAPRTLLISVAGSPQIDGPPAPRAGRSGAAPGKLINLVQPEVVREFERAMVHYRKVDPFKQPRTENQRYEYNIGYESAGGNVSGGDLVIDSFDRWLKTKFRQSVGEVPRLEQGEVLDPAARHKRQFDELVEFTQKLMRNSAKERDKFWSKADRSSLATWEKSAQFYRDYVYDEMIGRLPDPTMPPNVRTRQVLDEPAFRAYEVVIDVYPDVIASGILLLPKDLKAGEKRPVVVCQHGLEGTPMDTITRDGRGYQYYKAFAAELAGRGFITYAPQNPYRGQDKFRTLQRKSNPLKRSLFSYIIRQHERTLEFLKTLPNVDAKRIAFYGLSYGGKTAVRVPPFVQDYCLSICSADFNEWVVKNATVSDRYSYMFTGEYEIFEWNMGHVANYAELSTLMTPRPFMVERGHGDGVAPDEWVAWEFAKVRRHYDALSLGDKTEIEFFNGPHTINGQATYAFLHRHLNWPQR